MQHERHYEHFRHWWYWQSCNTAIGFSTLKEEQREVVKNFVRGSYAFVALPNGFGKSIMLCCTASCFWFASWLSAVDINCYLRFSFDIANARPKGKIAPWGLVNEFIGERLSHHELEKANLGLVTLVLSVRRWYTRPVQYKKRCHNNNC